MPLLILNSLKRVTGLIKMCPNCLLILIGGNLSRMALLSPAGWRYAVWGARWVGKSICSSAIMNHRLPLPMKISEKTPLQPSFLLSPVYWQLLCSRGCISGQMGPDDQHYHNLAHPKHTPILTIKWLNGNLAGHWPSTKSPTFGKLCSVLTPLPDKAIWLGAII